MDGLLTSLDRMADLDALRIGRIGKVLPIWEKVVRVRISCGRVVHCSPSNLSGQLVAEIRDPPCEGLRH